MLTFLVTGASGFVGLNLVENLLARGETVVSLSARAPDAEWLRRFHAGPGTLVSIEGDVRDRELVASIFDKHDISRVLHGAVVTANAAREMREAEDVLSVNLGGLAVVLNEAGRHKVERFVFVSSIGVYGTTPADGAVLDESLPHTPATLYGITKSTGEAVVARLAALHGIDWVVGRLGVVFGPYEYETGVRDTLSSIYCITRIAEAGGEAVLPRDAAKNFQYSRDAAACLANLLTVERHAEPIYNLGPAQTWQLSAWCRKLAERYPDFRWRIGDGPGDAVGIWTPRDGGVLSGDLYAAEFGPTARFGPDEAFADYMAFLEKPENALFRPNRQ